MSKKSPKSIPSKDTKKSETGKNPTKPTSPKSKGPVGDDDFDASLYDDDLRFDNFEEDEDDDF